MKVLWLSNVVLPCAAQALSLPAQVGGSWLTGQIEALGGELASGAVKLSVLAPSPKTDKLVSAEANGVRWLVAPGGKGRELAAFKQVLDEEKPDVVHVFGTEYPHNRLMLELAGPQRSVVSIQGLVGFIAGHYADGLPRRFARRNPAKMLMKRLYAAGVVEDERRMFEKAGNNEAEMLRQAAHVIGRTEWDKACLWLLAPNAQYHHCDEVLRREFYTDDVWHYENCEPQTIFLSQGYYPVKGAHFVLRRLPEILARWPDARVQIAGQKPYTLQKTGTQWAVDFFFEYQGYLKKLCRTLGIERRVEWLGPLGAEEMRAAYLRANVFINPSTIENSPNSVAESMALGVPVVASAVGGVPSMLEHGSEGFLYPRGEDYLLPYWVDKLFGDAAMAATMGAKARMRALLRHSPAEITETLLSVYRGVAQQ